ncbi:MAG: N-terminal cleavage protein [Rariglobus sp.]|jgi:prepilin-type processing-associated H-X9-DG protein/prepilin-type N-terminal cleavage/methylation domain-containing protein|nr:N-terminal cleavage protein [Rariglobus sp.]
MTTIKAYSMTACFSKRGQALRAFTLVELLAVIAIVALLLALVFAGIGRVRDRAKSALCTSNLRASSVVLLGYAAEHRQRLPIYWQRAGSTTWWGWDQLLLEKGYVEFTNAPGLESRLGERITSCPLSYDSRVLYLKDSQAYGINCYMWTAEGNLPSTTKVSEMFYDPHGTATHRIDSLVMSEIPNPGRFVLLADSFDKWVWDNVNKLEHQKSVFGEDSSLIWRRHSGGFNAAFADGHVKHVKPEDSTRYLTSEMAWGNGYWVSP